jgi:hypothetical protein
MPVKSQVERGPTQRSVEIGVAVCTAAFALIVLGGSIQVGVGWGAEGPKAGFFPFYVALLILASSIINLGGALSGPRSNRLFAEWGHLGQVISIPGANGILCGPHTLDWHLRRVRHAHCRFHEMARRLRVGNGGSSFNRCTVGDVRHLRKVVPGAFAERPDRGIPRLLTTATFRSSGSWNGRDR